MDIQANNETLEMVSREAWSLYRDMRAGHLKQGDAKNGAALLNIQIAKVKTQIAMEALATGIVGIVKRSITEESEAATQ